MNATKSGEHPPPEKRRAKQRWPFIKKRVYLNGTVAWQVDARTKTGGERKAFGTRLEAETFADQCRARRTNEGITAFGNEELAKYGKSVQDAISFYLDHLRAQERTVPLDTAITELVESRRTGGKSAEYCYGLKLRLGRFGKDFTGRSAGSLTAKEIDAWLVGLKALPATRNTFRRDVQTLFSFCVKRGYSKENPALGAEIAKEIDKPPGILTVDEAKRLLACCGADVLPYAAIGMFAGLRSAELEKLDWTEVDLASGFIEVKAHKAKTGRRRLVKIADNLKAWLEPLAQPTGVVAPIGLRKRFEAARRRTGFDTPGTETPEEKAAGLKLKDWPQNALRHSYGSYWLAKHQDTAALALQMGNSTQMIFAHYRELVKPKDAEAFWGISPSAEDAELVVPNRPIRQPIQYLAQPNPR